MTAGEVAIAGLLYNTNSSTNYLYTSSSFWLMSPDKIVSATLSTVGILYVDEYSRLQTNASRNLFGVRPVINLIPETIVTGSGSELDPFIVQ